MSHIHRYVAAAAVAIILQLTPATGQSINVPSVPVDIKVPAGNVAFLKGHAVGTQNYACLPSGSSFAWTPLGPQATLFVTLPWNQPQQIATHFFSRTPEDGVIRPTWQSSFDTSAVWGAQAATSSDPAFVAPGAIAWLLLRAADVQTGPSGGSLFAQTTFIHRLATTGGLKPATGCSEFANVGAIVYIPYTADYYFYRAGR
jgi:Protein of unknown function (DUF3455)